MTKYTSLSLDDRLARFIEQQVSSGRFASETDVVTAALDLLEEQQRHLSSLRDAIDEGDRSGASAPFDFAEFIERKRSQRDGADG